MPKILRLNGLTEIGKAYRVGFGMLRMMVPLVIY
jgi:hypothetical protein